MKISLNVQMGQHLTMTPQLQQAIRLLQLSTIELQQEIQNALDSNPLLEVSDDDHNTLTTAANSAAENSNEVSSDNHQQDDYETEASATLDINTNTDMPDDLPVDSAWDDVFTGSSTSSGSQDEDDEGFESRSTVAETLYDHLLWQVNLTHFSLTDRTIAVCIIDSLDDNGYLTAELNHLVLPLVTYANVY